MPWLVGTALIHSLAVTEKRGGFKSWTVLLAILAFSLSLLGTFLVRSGVLTSVHAFATDPEARRLHPGLPRVVIGASLALFAWRAPKVGLGGQLRRRLARIDAAREQRAAHSSPRRAARHALPAVLDALNLGKISVGPPYFDAVFVR
jgi:cytochrome c-type biogenesis protein CcmF